MDRPEQVSVLKTYNRIFKSNFTISKLKDATLNERLFPSSQYLGVPGRSMAWKVFLSPLEPLEVPSETKPKPNLPSLRRSRADYRDRLLDRMKAPDGSYEDGFIIPGSNAPPTKTAARGASNLETNNPLSLHNENPWTEWFASVELRKTILQDVERTYPEIDYFRDPQIQHQLTNILFLYSATQPSIGYRQGMHELLAALYYAVDFDSLNGLTQPSSDNDALEFCSRNWVTADAWFLFEAVMKGVSRWFEWRESASMPSIPTSSGTLSNVGLGGSIDTKPYITPVVQTCQQLQSVFLKSVDPTLFRSMQTAGIEPQIYGIRWLRLLFTREFSLKDAMVLWDGLFASDPTFELAQWVCVAMLIRIRNQLIPSDYSSQLTYLLRYPQIPSPSTPNPSHLALSKDLQHRQYFSLLIRQALELQISPTLATGTTLIVENQVLLGIPSEVPDPPPVPGRRVSVQQIPGGSNLRHNARDKATYEVSTGKGQQHNRGSSAAIGQGPVGLPELFARGLMDKTESFGINKTFLNAVSEIRRNIPELSSIVRTPLLTPSQPTHTNFALLSDERTPEDRPPWEPRTRFEVEKELLEYKKMNKKIGDSVGWILNALERTVDHAESRERKEAFEALAYVRDILTGVVVTGAVDGNRLLKEEERQKPERNKEQDRGQTADAAALQAPDVVVPAGSLPTTSPSQSYFPEILSQQRVAQQQVTPALPHSSSQPTSFPLSPSADSPIPTPALMGNKPNSSSDVHRLAPWNQPKRSSFVSQIRNTTGSSTLPATSLPRLPPPSSAGTSASVLPSPQPRQPPSAPLPGHQQRPTEASKPRSVTVQHDPLGVL